ncbi:MAG: NAD(P)-binding protein [Candidatus Omnitrophota bacterium]|jgi:phytoene dehydrogenase-like protein
MKQYNDIVVGSGVSGMTLALLLAMNGRKVLLLEKAPQIGGSLRRFYKQGIPFDTGFHFTGGFSQDGVLADMLEVVGIRDFLKPVFLSKPGANRFIFEREGAVYDLPSGIENSCAALRAYFPRESAAIDAYFALMQKVCYQTMTLDLRKIAFTPEVVDEDYVSLDAVLDSLTADARLRALLSAYCMCHGTQPKEISFANHARVGSGLFESVARIEQGGDAFIRAFRGLFVRHDIDIRCKAYIAECARVQDDYVGEFVLNTGEVIQADDCIFTIHPHGILKILPQRYLSKAFVDRVSAYESSIGFFSVFGEVKQADVDDFGPSLVSLFPAEDINVLLDPDYGGMPALAVIRSVEEGLDNQRHCVINAFEPSFYSQVRQWADSTVGKRPQAYAKYKARKAAEITRRIEGLYPQYRGTFTAFDAASVLTFRDYLNSPDGSAYGIKQKISQFNLFGKLPLRNLYAAGQSSVLPGLVGAMVSSFVVARGIVGKELYNEFITGHLCS